MWLRSTLLILLLSAIPMSIAAQPTNTPQAKRLPSHPTEVALVDEGERGSVYRQFPSGLRLYTHDTDRPGRSACNGACALAWPPVVAPPGSVVIGDWTIVVRQDGSRQWALKGKPVYTRFHDAPDQPSGDGLFGTWRVVPHTRLPVNPTPATASR